MIGLLVPDGEWCWSAARVLLQASRRGGKTKRPDKQTHQPMSDGVELELSSEPLKAPARLRAGCSPALISGVA